MARALARGGWDVALSVWPPSADAEELCEELAALGARTALSADDLADPAAAARAFDAAERAVGPVTALVAAHAHSTRGGVAEATAEDLERHLLVNARGTALLLGELARRFSGPHGSGRAVTFTSGLPLRGELAYAASKGAVEWLTISAAAELLEAGISANVVDPGPNDTGWMGDDLRRQIAAESPGGRIGTPEDAAALVAFLLSPGGGWIAGQVLHVDGGWSSLR